MSRPSPMIISAGASSACSTAPRRRTPICAGFASPTAFSRPRSSKASPMRRSATAAAMPDVQEGFGVEPGVAFRLAIGGITGHKDFARETGVIVKPHEATLVADAVVRVFIDEGDRTNRTKARLKYVIDVWGMEKFLAAMEEKLGRKLTRVSLEALAPRPMFDRFAH